MTARLDLTMTDYWDSEKKRFIAYRQTLIKTNGIVRVYDEMSADYWNCRIVSIKYCATIDLYKYELKKL